MKLFYKITSKILILIVIFYLQPTPKGTPPPSPSQNVQPVIVNDTDQDEGPKAELDLCTGPKDAYVVEVSLFDSCSLFF